MSELRTWTGTNSDESWTIEVEVDCMASDEPFTVSVWVSERPQLEDPKGNVEGAFLSSHEAREVAQALIGAADRVDRENGRADVLARLLSERETP